MKLLFSFILLSIQGVTLAQNNIKSYYSNINKAELSLINNSLDSSAYYFKKAFANKKYPFAKHVYTAAIVSQKLFDNNSTRSNIKYLLRFGADINKLSENKDFSYFFKSQTGKDFIQKYKNIKPKYDKTYREAILKMIEDDQFYRIKNNSYSLYGDTIKKIDKRNIETLLSLIKQKGFPTEQKIGIDTNNFISPLYSLIIIHQSMGPLQQFDFSNIIQENIINGNIENSAGTYLITRSSPKGLAFSELVKLQYVSVIDSTKSASNPNNVNIIESSDWGIFKLSDMEKEKLNSFRKDYFLSLYDENIKLILFSLKNPEFNLTGVSNKSIMNFTNYEGYKEVNAKIIIQ